MLVKRNDITSAYIINQNWTIRWHHVYITCYVYIRFGESDLNKLAVDPLQLTSLISKPLRNGCSPNKKTTTAKSKLYLIFVSQWNLAKFSKAPSHIILNPLKRTVLLTSAPFSRRVMIVSTWPNCAATCSGVNPSASPISTSPPWSTRCPIMLA